MESLKRFDVAEVGGVAVVVIESDLIPPDTAIVVIPLLPDYPAVRYLNPVLRFEDREFVLATRLIAAVHRSRLARKGSVGEQGDVVIRAMDVLLGGV